MAKKINCYKYQFVSPPPDDVICSICLDIVKEPHQFTCCGQHICKICGEQLKEQASTQPCPMCRHSEYGTVPDKYFERNILNKLFIWCTEGCGQEVELGQLKSHLDQCTCVKEDCPCGCGKQYQRQYIEEHKEKCPKRPFVCSYCDYKSSYEVIVNEHHPVCNKYPIVCPNKCSGNNEIERGKLKGHLNKCPFQLVKCEFSHVGCQEKVRRCDLSQHLSDSGLYHTAVSTKMIYESLQKLMKEKDRQIEEKERQIQEKDKLLQEKDEELKERKKSMDVVFKKLEYLECVVGNIRDTVCGDVALSVTMTKCQYKIDNRVQWFSPPFFTHPNGYKMHFEVHFTSLLISIYTYVMKGPYDDQLQWPFKGKVIVRVLNQCGDHNHYDYLFDYRDNDRDSGKRQQAWKLPLQSHKQFHAEDVAGDKREMCLSSQSACLTIDKLDYNNDTICQYLENDCLYFKVIVHPQ